MSYMRPRRIKRRSSAESTSSAVDFSVDRLSSLNANLTSLTEEDSEDENDHDASSLQTLPTSTRSSHATASRIVVKLEKKEDNSIRKSRPDLPPDIVELLRSLTELKNEVAEDDDDDIDLSDLTLEDVENLLKEFAEFTNDIEGLGDDSLASSIPSVDQATSARFGESSWSNKRFDNATHQPVEHADTIYADTIYSPVEPPSGPTHSSSSTRIELPPWPNPGNNEFPPSLSTQTTLVEDNANDGIAINGQDKNKNTLTPHPPPSSPDEPTNAASSSASASTSRASLHTSNIRSSHLPSRPLVQSINRQNNTPPHLHVQSTFPITSSSSIGRPFTHALSLPPRTMCAKFTLAYIAAATASLSISIVYSALAKDTSGGFTVGAYVVALASMVIMPAQSRHWRTCRCAQSADDDVGAASAGDASVSVSTVEGAVFRRAGPQGV